MLSPKWLTSQSSYTTLRKYIFHFFVVEWLTAQSRKRKGKLSHTNPQAGTEAYGLKVKVNAYTASFCVIID